MNFDVLLCGDDFRFSNVVILDVFSNFGMARRLFGFLSPPLFFFLEKKNDYIGEMMIGWFEWG